MRRNYIKKGDKTTSGGVVTEGLEFMSHHGTQLSFLGAQISCHACGSIGTIVAQGPRWPGDIMGKHAALENDKCVCRCHPAPTLVASQNDMFQFFKPHELEGMGYAPDGTPLAEPVSKIFDEQVRVIDGKNRPMAGVPYYIKVPTGEVLKGLSDENGYCARVATESSEQLHVAVGIKALEYWTK